MKLSGYNQGNLAAKERKERKEQPRHFSMRSLRSFAAKRFSGLNYTHHTAIQTF
jgi:hypothetical protein